MLRRAMSGPIGRNVDEREGAFLSEDHPDVSSGPLPGDKEGHLLRPAFILCSLIVSTSSA